MALAGYSATPAEEMPADGPTGAPTADVASEELQEKMHQALAELVGYPGENHKRAATVINQIAEDAGGDIPRIVARSFLRAAVQMREVKKEYLESGTDVPVTAEDFRDKADDGKDVTDVPF